MNSLYNIAQANYKEARHLQAQQLLLNIDASDNTYIKSRTLLLRCFLEQGKIGEAASLVNKLNKELFIAFLPEAPLEDVTELRLWCSAARLYSTQNWAEHIDFCDEIINAGNLPKQIALAADLKLTGEIFSAILTGRIAPKRNQEIFGKFEEVADLYRKLSLTEEYLWAKFKQAGFGFNKEEHLRREARRIFTQIGDESSRAGELILAARAALSLAEMDFLEAHDEQPPQTPDYTELAVRFEAAASQFRKAGHPFPDELIALQFGILSLKYGLEEGEKFIKDSLSLIEENENYKLVDAGLRELETWYISHGKHLEEKENKDRLKRISQKMQFGLAFSVGELSERNYLFRKGETAAALKSSNHEALLEQAFLLNASNTINSAVTLNEAGRVAESRNLLEKIIGLLEDYESLQILGEAWSSYGATFIPDDITKAVECVTKAIEIENTLHNKTALGQRYAFRAWLRVNYNRTNNISPAISPEAEADFDAALQILQKNRTLEARNALISLCQMRGQAAMVDQDWKACGHWLTQAETLASALKLNPQIAFTLDYQGLALIQIARAANFENSYKAASERFQQVENLFREAGLFPFVWRPIYHQALCEYEAGERTDTKDEKRNERFRKANDLLKKAVGEINNLYALTSDDGDDGKEPVSSDSAGRGGNALEQYKGSLPFLVNKQEVFKIGFQLAWFYLNDSAEAFWWLEQMKARNLIKFLARKLPAPDKIKEDSTLQILTSLKKGEPVDWKIFLQYLQRQQKKAGGRRILIAGYYCSAQYSMVILMRSDWDFPVFERLPLDYKKLESFVSHHFNRKGGVRQMLEDVGESPWQSFSALIEPLAMFSAPEDIICIIPNGILHNLPLHTLKVNESYLIERNPVYYSPSASLLHYVDQEAKPDSDNTPELVEVFGNPTEDLRFAEAEAESIADYFGVKAKIRDEATKENFVKAIEKSDIIHFAGHGELAFRDGFLSRLFLADGETLSAGEILNLQTKAKLVVLSGCETGLSEKRVGDELLGLTTSFLAIGADSLIASQWQVNDESSKELLEEFYKIRRGASGKANQSKADALRTAVNNLRKQPKWESFYHWGSFVLYGNCF